MKFLGLYGERERGKKLNSFLFSLNSKFRIQSSELCGSFILNLEF